MVSARQRTRFLYAAAMSCFVFAPGTFAQAQVAGDTQPTANTTEESAAALPNAPDVQNGEPTLLGTPKRIVLDFAHLVQFPGHLHGEDTKWLLPLTAATVTSFALDEHTMENVVTTTASTNNTSETVSDWLERHPDESEVLYGAAVDLLVRLQAAPPPPDLVALTPTRGAGMIAPFWEHYGAGTDSSRGLPFLGHIRTSSFHSNHG